MQSESEEENDLSGSTVLGMKSFVHSRDSGLEIQETEKIKNENNVSAIQDYQLLDTIKTNTLKNSDSKFKKKAFNKKSGIYERWFSYIFI